LLIVLFFSRSARPLLAKVRPLLVRLRIERPLRSFYDGVHHFRSHGRLMLNVFIFTTVIQAVRILDLGVVQGGRDRSQPAHLLRDGPLFFLVLLVPFTLNGFAVREAFFVSFLGSVGVNADAAFAAGFLFFSSRSRSRFRRGDPSLGVGAGGARPEVGHG
jgi:hypothetical protein